jgi:hypothetical protein
MRVVTVAMGAPAGAPQLGWPNSGVGKPDPARRGLTARARLPGAAALMEARRMPVSTVAVMAADPARASKTSGGRR